jgi:hypothetical protein
MNILSFYIPRISITYNELSIVIAFKNMNIGVVKRVDFIVNKETDIYQSAFVHMDFMYYNDYTEQILTTVFHNNKSIRVYPNTINRRLYWILLKNKNPVTETRLNIHQLAENCRLLEEKLDRHQKYIRFLVENFHTHEKTNIVLLNEKQTNCKRSFCDLINEIYS